jgi:hypothetical protein
LRPLAGDSGCCSSVREFAVCDDKTHKPAGLTADYKAVNAQNPGPDSYELYLHNMLGGSLKPQSGGNIADMDLYTITRLQIDGQDVWRVAVKAAPQPIWFDGHLFVRSGNQKRRLTAQEALDYVPQHWPELGKK